ncbi:acetyl-CoA carboxylase biotin carboxyl carrier protein subunit [Arenibacter sp. N53]|uniref:acetyl-CoA carboxylase biotin carboxyl carrier protein subunit n=1 Tax=Arenibacter TaxID=178469 RepID=UPI000CD473A8|nr:MULTISPECIES: acetyl-CoA carboxylase biotin carboxyl carrier protein subunit [Arenibacter]MCM4151696.1 acetyl-CoA carboxylase biotin carboxyl carrier protein subunit [Arenibacter sp. N53]
MTHYNIIVDKENFKIGPKDIESMDMIATGSLKYHSLMNNQSFVIQILDADFANKTMTIEVNGNSYEMYLEDEYDQMVNKMGLLTAKTHKINSIKAPMPGLIIDIMATIGQEVLTGTPLIVLSAMKMENIINSTGEGVVKNIKVKVNDAVDKGQIIIEME